MIDANRHAFLTLEVRVYVSGTWAGGTQVERKFQAFCMLHGLSVGCLLLRLASKDSLLARFTSKEFQYRGSQARILYY